MDKITVVLQSGWESGRFEAILPNDEIVSDTFDSFNQLVAALEDIKKYNLKDHKQGQFDIVFVI